MKPTDREIVEAVVKEWNRPGNTDTPARIAAASYVLTKRLSQERQDARDVVEKCGQSINCVTPKFDLVRNLWVNCGNCTRCEALTAIAKWKEQNK